MVNGFDMDQLFSKRQAAPTTTPSTTGCDTNLASIATLMSNISSKNAAKSANNDKEETISYNNMPKDVQERCSLKNHPTRIIAKEILVTS